MNGYVKLFGSIIASTVWRESKAVKILWITMLVMKNEFDLVEASIPGLADMARLTVDETKEALKVLEAPDTYSRTQDYEGRRIEKVEGGWRILNGEKYRRMLDPEHQRQLTAKRVQRYRARKRGKTEDVTLAVTEVTQGNAPLRQAEAKTEAEAFSNTGARSPHHARAGSQKDPDAESVLDFLNKEANRMFRPVDDNLRLIRARLKEGVTVEQCKAVIKMKVKEWVTKSDMTQYLRPETLFNPTKFEGYLGQIGGNSDGKLQPTGIFAKL